MSQEDKDQEGISQEYLDGVPIKYFTEGLTDSCDLMELDVHEDVFGGMLGEVVATAKDILAGLRGCDVRNLLLLGDNFIVDMVKRGHPIVTGDEGETEPLTETLLQRITPINMLAFYAGSFDGMTLQIRGVERESGVSRLDVTASRMLAAFALCQANAAMAYDGQRGEWATSEGGYHGMQAAESCAYAKVLSGDIGTLRPLIGRKQMQARGRDGAAARLANDTNGKQAAKNEALLRWQAWQRGEALHKSGAAFARHVVESMPIENTKTVERWMKEWATDARNRD